MPDMLLKFLIQNHLGMLLCIIAVQSKIGEENHVDPNQKTHECGTEWKSCQNTVIFTQEVDCAPEMANVIIPAISATCVDLEYAKCSIICASSFLMSLCFIAHLEVTPHFHLQ